jgi:murein DD-endopeptidase MepM/ murein hydrolase activator NlpD
MTGAPRKPAPGSVDAVGGFLRSADCAPATIIATDGKAIVLDLSRGSLALGESLENIDVDRFGRLVERAMTAAGTSFAFGRYAEDRELYNNAHFDSAEGSESRAIHMGIDLFCSAGTEVHAPLDGVVSIIANNRQELDYGPMLVLRHEVDEHHFYTLYGHLALQSISRLVVGQTIAAGEIVAATGSPPENGNWPPHLHFQIIVDLLDLGRDFPGVAYASQQDFWLSISPSPARFFPECPATLLNCGMS